MQPIVQGIIDDVSSGIFVAVLGAIVLWLSKTRKRLSFMVEDWQGEEARPGVSARPGVMVRLQNIEQNQAIVDAKVSNIEHEVNFNSGMSIKDAVHRVDKGIADLDNKFSTHIENQKS